MQKNNDKPTFVLCHDPSLDTPETCANLIQSLPNTSYQYGRRKIEMEEWRLGLKTLISLQPIVSGNRIQRYSDCRTRAFFYRYNPTGKVKVLSSSCRDRVCPVCASVRSRQVGEQITDWVKAAKNPRFLTLTLRSSNAPLAMQINNLYRSFRYFRQMKELKSVLLAGVWFFQVTFNARKKQWHPHLHCLLIGKWCSQKTLSELWKRASKGSYIVDIKSIKNPEETAAYVSRYSARPYRLKGLDLAQRQEVVLAFKSRKLFGVWGKPPQKPEIKTEKIKLSDWTSLGSWSCIVANKDSDQRAKKIWEAWVEDKELEVGIVCKEYDKNIDCEWVGEIDVGGSKSQKKKRKNSISVDAESFSQILFSYEGSL